ncbi:MAG TPA: hypothetical protein VJI96_04395 [Candidatus Andersenbacteria bacterium]|nr:hypothetical protein [Candidatus Andersenbacteria bacterium]
MKFAVIEYSSKTKSIWRHTAERPNYVCDPIHEIDPTSFGCYVSALEGEHIPLTSLIVGKNVNPIVGIFRKIKKRLSGNWPLDYDISYLKSFDVLLVVYQLSDGHEMLRFIKKLRTEHPSCKVLGVPTQPYGILREAWDAKPESITEIKQFMDQCDVFLTIVKRTLPIWKKMSSVNIQYVPQPYPVEYACEKYRPRDKKSNILFVAGVTGRDSIAKGQLVAVQLQKLFPTYRIQMAAVPGMELDVKNLQGSSYDIIPFQPWQEHLSMLSRVALIINTDYTQTRGRVQADSAAVGTPSIGANSDAQDDLFPKLHAERETTVEQLVLQGKQLLNDSSYYNEIMQTAIKRLKEYDYKHSKKRIEDLVL